MYLTVIAWLYVTLMMALVEAFSTQGTVLGAVITFLLYGLVPISLVIYLFGTPLRYKARQKSEPAAQSTSSCDVSGLQPDASGHAPSLTPNTAVTSVRKEERGL